MSRSVKRARTFLVTWTLAVLATVCAFVLHLALRGRTVSLGYDLGRARAEQARLREVKRVLELEAASYKSPSGSTSSRARSSAWSRRPPTT